MIKNRCLTISMIKSKKVGFTYISIKGRMPDILNMLVVNTCLIQFAPVQDCLPGTYVLNKNQVIKFCEENSKSF